MKIRKILTTGEGSVTEVWGKTKGKPIEIGLKTRDTGFNPWQVILATGDWEHAVFRWEIFGP